MPYAAGARWLRQASLREWLAIAAAASALGAALGALNGLGRSDRTLYDAVVSRHTHGSPRDIVVVAIDDESVRELGRWPWRRAIVATLVEKIAAAQPRGIALDLLLSESDARDPSGDLHLAAALRTHARVVLPVVMDPGPSRRPRPVLPAPQFERAGVRLGHGHFEADADGIVRSVFLEEGTAARIFPALALALVRDELGARPLPGLRNPSPVRAEDSWRRDRWLHLAFSGAPGTVARVPAVRVLTGEYPAADFSGKYVLIGATAAGLGDAYPTPVTGEGELLPGVELHAQLADNLLHDRAITPASPAANAAFTLLPIWLALLGFLVLSPRRSLALVAALLALTPVLAWAGVVLARIWFAPSAALLVLAAIYPVWSWRRLEAALAFLSEEFARLRSEPALVPQAPAQPAAAEGDLLERRIESVRQAADSLRHARRFIADSIDHLPVAALVAGLDERLLIANHLAARCFAADSPARLLGAPVAEMLGRLAPPQTAPWDRAKAALAADPASAIEIADREGHRYLLQAAHCFDAANIAVGYLVTLVDITPIRDAERLRDEALAFVSHDLRSPQASILAAVELNRVKPEEFPAARMLEQIEHHARRTIALADEFVELARAETGAWRSERFDLGQVASEALEQVRAQAQEKSIGLTLQAEGEAPMTGDRRLLLRAIANLAGNAIKYSPAGASVTLSVARAGARLRCSVRDQGYGISPEDQKRLFRSFTRVSAPGQPRDTGIGLGLAFVKAVIERHGGRLEVDSAVGEGSEFAFSLDAAGD